jgi:hypothetical protein
MMKFRRLLPIGILLLTFFIGISPALAEEENLTEKIATLEQNLTVTERQLEVTMSRTANLLTRIEELENTVDHLLANLSRVTKFSVPSQPPDFRIESIGRDSDGNYSVVLRWRNNPEHEAVHSYVVWFAVKGYHYLPVTTVNRTEGVMRTKIPGFIKDHEIVFKIFARNEAGQGEPSYRETTIRGYAPYLMSRLRLAALVLVLLGIVVVAWWKFPRGESGED